MNRAAFLKSLGINGAALMAVYCMGGITSCVNSEREDPQPTNPQNPSNPSNPNPPVSNKIDFTLDLVNFPKLQSVNGFDYNGNIIIVRTGTDTFVALSKVCTHAGTTVTFVNNVNRIYCENHGSNFNLDGTVINGPASSALKKYNTEFTAATNKLRVFES